MVLEGKIYRALRNCVVKCAVLYILYVCLFQIDVFRTDDPKHSALNVTINTFNNTLSRGYLNWNNNLWQDDVNVTYYRVKLSLAASQAEYLLYEFYDAVKNVSRLHAVYTNVVKGLRNLFIYWLIDWLFHWCIYLRNLQALRFPN